MAITVEARTNLVGLVVGMFGAAPGASVLSDLVAAYNAGSSVKQIAANLATSAEYTGIYPTFLTNVEFATKIVDQLVGNEVIASEKALAVTELTARLNSGQSRTDVFVDAIAAVDALESTNAQWGKAGVAFDNKVSVANYYSVDKQLSGSSLQQLQNVVGAVTSDAATVTTAKAAVDVVQNPGSTFTFTVGVDDLKGGSGDDVFNATITTTSAVLGALDVADGGTGNDTMNVVDTATAAVADVFLPAGLVIKNIENLNVTTNGALGTGTTTDFDVSTIAGLKSFVGVAAGAGTNGGSQIKAAGTTDVKLTVAGANTANVNGGQDVSIIAGTGATVIAGNATGTSSASIKGGGVATVTGNSMKSVVLDAIDITALTAGITSTGVDTITVKNQTSALATTLTNATSTSLTVNVDKAGYTAAGAAVAGVSVAAGAAAATINLNATGGKSNVAVSGAVAKTLNITGSADLTLSAPIATATKIDGSAATGALALGTLNAATVNVTTGTGKDSLQLSAVAKATVDTGAGNDTVTLGSAVAAGSTINLGAGDDKLLVVAGGSVAASTAGNTTVIDGGDGIDSVAASLINAANASQFKNFENIDVSAITATALDVELMTGSTITGLTLSGGTGGATVNNVAAGVGLSVAGNNTGTSTINVKGAATGTSDAFTVTFAGDAAASAPAAANVLAGTLVTEGVEALTIASNGGANTWNSAAVTDAKLKTVTITGDKNLDLTFVGVNGTNPTAAGGAVSSIDGSAATGKLNINTTNVVADSAAAGLTVKGGSAADTITLAQKATVNAGAGNDTIVTSAAGGTLTGGAGNDTFNVAAALATGITAATSALTTVTDFTAGDKIAFAANANTFKTAKVALGAGVTNLDLALQAAVTTANEVSWFQYGANTYVVADVDGTGALSVGDIAVKLTGLLDLSTSTLAANALTFA